MLENRDRAIFAEPMNPPITGVLAGSSIINATRTTTMPMLINTMPCHEEVEKRLEVVGDGDAAGSGGIMPKEAGEVGGVLLIASACDDSDFKRLILIIRKTQS